MNLIPLGLVLTVLASEPASVGWRPMPGTKEVQFLIQLTPETVEALQRGEALDGAIPAELPNVRWYRITAGQGALPRQLPVESPFSAPSAENQAANTAPAIPGDLMPDPSSRPLADAPGRQTAYTPPPVAAAPESPRDPVLPPRSELPRSEPPAAAPAPPMSSPSDSLPPVAETGKSFYAWTAALIALGVSVGLNVFLGWTTVDYRRRYEELALAEPSRVAGF